MVSFSGMLVDIVVVVVTGLDLRFVVFCGCGFDGFVFFFRFISVVG